MPWHLGRFIGLQIALNSDLEQVVKSDDICIAYYEIYGGNSLQFSSLDPSFTR